MSVQEHHGHRLAHDVTTADHNCVRALQLDVVLPEQRHHPERRCWHVRRIAEVEVPGVERVEAVDVLDGLDSADDARLVGVLRERELDEDAVDRVFAVQLGDELEQLLLGGV